MVLEISDFLGVEILPNFNLKKNDFDLHKGFFIKKMA
jgi:hypothetical protein